MADRTYVSIERQPIDLKKFTFGDVLSYAQLLNSAHKFQNTFHFEIKAGERLFKDKFVTNIASSVDESTGGRTYIKATVKASMSKAKHYRVDVYLDDNKQVTDAKCGCPGGIQPACCKHVFALLFGLHDYSAKELYKTPTEKLQTWHVPKPKLVAPKRVKERHILNNSINSDTPANDTSVDYFALAALPQLTPLFMVISETPAVFYKKTMPLPSCVPSGFAALSCPIAMVDGIFFYHEHVRYPFEQIIDLERKTIIQGDNNMWREERQKRLTASHVYDIIHSKDIGIIIDKILFPPNLNYVPAVEYGKRMEGVVKSKIIVAYPECTFRDTGLCINPIYPFLAASPDGLLYNKDSPMTVEIKCVFNTQGIPLEEICDKRKNFYLKHDKTNNTFSLKHTHKHYYQIQLQLFCTNLTKCLFIVYYGAKFSLHKEIIDFDPSLMDLLMPKLINVYFEKFLPKLMDKVK